MVEVVISGAESDLTKTESDAADCNKYCEKHRAAPRGEAARKPRARRMKHILSEPAGRKDDEHDNVKAAQSSFESTGYQLVNLKFSAKISEIELKRLMYQLGN